MKDQLIIEINGEEVKASLEEWEEVYNKLHKLMGLQPLVPVVPHIRPCYPYEYIPPLITYTDDSTDTKWMDLQGGTFC